MLGIFMNNSAYASGYCDVPRRINSEELARTLEPVKSTLVERLRKSEKRLITEILAEEEEPLISFAGLGRS